MPAGAGAVVAVEDAFESVELDSGTLAVSDRCPRTSVDMSVRTDSCAPTEVVVNVDLNAWAGSEEV